MIQLNFIKPKYNPDELDMFYNMLGLTEANAKSKIKEDEKLKKMIEYLKLNMKTEKLERSEAKGRSLHVAYLSAKMAEKAGLYEDEIKDIYFAGLFHDVGKSQISPKIIGKPGPLTDEEYEIVKTHVAKSVEMLEGLVNKEVIAIVANHHERMDKSGYPQGIIPPNIGSKIIGIVDSYDAMTSKKVYNDSKSKQIAFQELKMCALSRENGGIGSLYDPQLVDILVTLEENESILQP